MCERERERGSEEGGREGGREREGGGGKEKERYIPNKVAKTGPPCAPWPTARELKAIL